MSCSIFPSSIAYHSFLLPHSMRNVRACVLGIASSKKFLQKIKRGPYFLFLFSHGFVFFFVVGAGLSSHHSQPTTFSSSHSPAQLVCLRPPLSLSYSQGIQPLEAVLATNPFLMVFFLLGAIIKKDEGSTIQKGSICASSLRSGRLTQRGSLRRCSQLAVRHLLSSEERGKRI